MTCQQIESLLPPFVDGLAGAEDSRQVAIHLAGCELCRRLVDAQRSARIVLRARAHELGPVAPPELRVRVAGLGQPTHYPRKPILGWHGRLSAVGAAIVVVLVVGALLVPLATVRSTVLLAAELALDHLKCFVIDGDAGGPPITSAQAEAIIRSLYGWSLKVPASELEGVRLVAVRRCLYGDGMAAHLLYRVNGTPVSLFIMPGLSRPSAELGVLGHAQVVWSLGDTTYMAVASATESERLHRVASQFRIEAQ